MTLKLTSARIQNFKSLGDVTLNFRDLTILVGPNSSGKSNCLQSLNFLNNIVKIGSLYSEYSDTQASVLSLLLRPLLKHDSFDLMNFKIFVEQENHQNKANYQLGINILSQKPFVDQENLLVGNKPIIRIKKSVHPGMLLEIASILKRLSKRTQVIITTHSSQLLDCFTFEEIRSDVAVILLNKKDSAIGTQAIMLDKLAETREDLAGWMQDFGVGSAVYDSNLLQDLLDRKYA